VSSPSPQPSTSLAYAPHQPLDDPVKHHRIQIALDGKLELARKQRSCSVPTENSPVLDPNCISKPLQPPQQRSWFGKRVFSVLSSYKASDPAPIRPPLREIRASSHMPDISLNPSPPLPTNPSPSEASVEHMLIIDEQSALPATPGSKKRKVRYIIWYI
jgi:hypothetical protein